jgi:IclR family acetate operon transcriptional repressor
VSSSTHRALRILEAVGAAGRPVGTTEVGRALAIPPGTAFRALDALERAGYVTRFQASAKYVLGAAVGGLRQNLLARFPIRDVCLPYLRQLAFASGEAASLTVRLGWYGVRIAAAPGTNEVTSSPPLGGVRLLADGCACRAILASLEPNAADAYVAWARRHVKRVPDATSLIGDLGRIRARGFAIEETAFARGRGAIALAVRSGRHAIAAIAIEGPVLDLASMAEHGDLPHWREIVQSVERLVQARPALFAGPFDHLDPDDIVLP